MSRRPIAIVIGGTLLLAGCGAEPFTPSVTLDRGTSPASWPVLHVDDDAQPGGDGSGATPYLSLLDAVGRARILGAAVVIVHPGRYELDHTIQIDTPIDLKGSNQMEVDAHGWPTGVVAPETEARIVGVAALGAGALLSIGRQDAGVLQHVEIRGLSLEAGPGGGNAVELARVQDFTVRNNVVTGPAFSGIFTIASSGRIVGNYITGVGAGSIIDAGTAASPATVEFSGNRSIRNRFAGVLLNGVAFGIPSAFVIPELGDQLTAAVRDNDLSENTALARFSSGIRVFVIRRDLGVPGDFQSTGNVQATIADNRIVGNEIGMVIDAGFPYRRVGSTCDPRTYSGTLDLNLKGNLLSGSLLTSALITFTRNTAALNQGQLSQWQYLHGATFSIQDADGTLAGATIDHPAQDPFVGNCPNDVTHESLGNSLIYNRAVVPFIQSVP